MKKEELFDLSETCRSCHLASRRLVANKPWKRRAGGHGSGVAKDPTSNGGTGPFPCGDGTIGCWRIVATMRTPQAALLSESDRRAILPLDVTDAGSIAGAVVEADTLDVWANNAGVGLLMALEGLSMESAWEVFEANTLGMRTHLVIPRRSPETALRANARTRMGTNVLENDSDLAGRVFASFQHATEELIRASDVADAVWRVAIDPACPTRLSAGADAVAWAAACHNPSSVRPRYNLSGSGPAKIPPEPPFCVRPGAVIPARPFGSQQQT